MALQEELVTADVILAVRYFFLVTFFICFGNYFGLFNEQHIVSVRQYFH